MGKLTGKRSLSSDQFPSKKRKLNTRKSPATKSKKAPKTSEKGKENAANRVIIDIPLADRDDDVDLSDQDMELLDMYGGAANFLDVLDQKEISRSKRETERLHRLNKPVKKTRIDDDLPSVDSHDEDEGSWNSDISDDQYSELSDEDESSLSQSHSAHILDSDREMPYETLPRKVISRPEVEDRGIQRLPIKLANGRIQETGRIRTTVAARSEREDVSDEEAEEYPDAELPRRDDIATGARFGRPAVVDVIGNKSRKARIQAAQDQIASICQEIVSDPENSLGLLRRLHTFSLPSISTPTHPEPVLNDLLIRKLALLSLLAVFKDVIPGYHIRPLTEKEKIEKVSQVVARTREYEQGLVVIYQTYLRSLEAELKSHSELAETSLQCICTLLTNLTHFNFRVNLMSCVVAQLSKKSWSNMSDLCLNTLIKVFRNDLTGKASLEVVRLLNRMVKEKRFNVHPNVLSCFLHLRLKNELGIRASESKADKETQPTLKRRPKGKDAARRAKGKPASQPHLSKKASKVMKEKKEIEREFREAEAEVDKEERAATHTETLKLLFVLYFGILKHPKPTPLLPAALIGISRFAHLVNIDFFRDLMKVLKDLIVLESPDDVEYEDVSATGTPRDEQRIQLRLLCIVTAFELLSGQGEALNVDLSDFITHLYAIILPLSLMPGIDYAPSASTKMAKQAPGSSIVDMLFRALHIAFSPRTLGSNAPSWRSVAFAKRLLTASMHWPTPAVLRTLSFVQGLMTRDPKLEALFSTEDRSFDGIYRPAVDDPQLCNPFGTCMWEIYALRTGHWDATVREEAAKVLANLS